MEMASSDTTAKAAMPEEVKAGFNWGAFWLNWIWGIGNNVWISFVVLVLPLIWNIYLGVKGNELAWLNREWESVEQFKQTQAVWSKWGWIIFIVQLVLTIIIWTIAGAIILAALGIAAAEGMDVPQ